MLEIFCDSECQIIIVQLLSLMSLEKVHLHDDVMQLQLPQYFANR